MAPEEKTPPTRNGGVFACPHTDRLRLGYPRLVTDVLSEEELAALEDPKTKSPLPLKVRRKLARDYRAAMAKSTNLRHAMAGYPLGRPNP